MLDANGSPGYAVGQGLPWRSPTTNHSPTLAESARDRIAAYELKLLLTEAQAREVEARVRRQMFPDPHGDPALGGAYRTTTLYLDTPSLDVLHRVGSHARRKYRVRRYDHGGALFVERKSKSGDRVRKRRALIADADLSYLGLATPSAWPGDWFQRQLQRRALQPVCRIAYERTAFTGLGETSSARLTLDRRLRGMESSAWQVESLDLELPLLMDSVICEFKYRDALPALFKEVIQSMQLTPRPVSKYRLFMATTRAETQ